MKLYKTDDGQFHGRRGDAGREAEIVEVATDANGLAAFLNTFKDEIEFWERRDTGGEECTKVVERADPPMSYTEQSVGGDDWFASVPVEHQLTLTQLALENARNEIGRLKSLERGGYAVPLDSPPSDGSTETSSDEPTAEPLANRMGATFEEPEYEIVEDEFLPEEPADETDPFA